MVEVISSNGANYVVAGSNAEVLGYMNTSGLSFHTAGLSSGFDGTGSFFISYSK